MRRLKKIIAVLSILLILFMLTGCQDELLDGSELDMSKLGPNEKYVKAMTICKDIETGEEYIVHRYKYDKWGNKIKRIYYNKDGTKDSERRWKYDKDGNLLKYIVDGQIYSHQEWSYNDQGQKTGYVKRNKGGGILEEVKYEYWNNGNLKSEKLEDYYGRKREIFYNKQGEPKRGLITTANGEKVKIKYQREYYDNGTKKKQVKQRIYNKKVITSKVRNYNRNGKEIKYVNRGGRVDSWYEKEYDKNGNRIKFTSKNKNGKIKNWKEYKYDKSGNEIELKRFYVKNDGNTVITDWIISNYDKRGHFLSWKRMLKKNKVSIIYTNKFKKIKIEKAGE